MNLQGMTQDQLIAMIKGLQDLVDGRYYDVDSIQADTGLNYDDAFNCLHAVIALKNIDC